MPTGPAQATASVHDVDRPRPEGALPRSLFRRLRSKVTHSGELRLALAVFQDAIHSLERNRGTKEFTPLLIRWEAEQWIASRSRDSLFAFENVCTYLELSSGRIREEIHRWRQRQGQETARPSPSTPPCEAPHGDSAPSLRPSSDGRSAARA